MFTGGCINTLNPKSTEIPLFGTTISISILESALNTLNGNAIATLRTTSITLCEFEDFFVTGVCGHTTFNMCHYSILLHTIRHKTTDDFGITLSHDCGAAGSALHFLGALPHSMSFS